MNYWLDEGIKGWRVGWREEGKDGGIKKWMVGKMEMSGGNGGMRGSKDRGRNGERERERDEGREG